jgi:hypothetical protein
MQFKKNQACAEGKVFLKRDGGFANAGPNFSIPVFSEIFSCRAPDPYRHLLLAPDINRNGTIHYRLIHISHQIA